jgi:hypothetical protein
LPQVAGGVRRVAQGGHEGGREQHAAWMMGLDPGPSGPQSWAPR